MPIIKIPKLVDVVTAFESSSAEMGKETGAMVSSAPGRFRNASGRRIDFAFMRLGDRKWKLSMSVEQLSSHESSSAFRIRSALPGENPEDEIVNVMNDEQLSDLALRYAEKVCNAAAGTTDASPPPAPMPTYTPPPAATPEENPSGDLSPEALLASIGASNAATDAAVNAGSGTSDADIASILAAAQAQTAAPA